MARVVGAGLLLALAAGSGSFAGPSVVRDEVLSASSETVRKAVLTAVSENVGYGLTAMSVSLVGIHQKGNEATIFYQVSYISTASGETVGSVQKGLPVVRFNSGEWYIPQWQRFLAAP